MSKDFPDTFFASDRADAKALTSSLTLEYIERLERIARAAWEYHQNSPSINDLIISYRNDLYEALDAVNFLNESL
jgi:hypothetical protein